MTEAYSESRRLEGPAGPAADDPGPTAVGRDRVAGWTPGELATLAAVAEAFVPGGAERRARLAAEALGAGTDPADVARLRGALRLFENPIANLVLTGRARRFRDMSPFSAHQMGTARAGADAGSHPCDPDGRVRVSGAVGARVVTGLYVADASLFPTAAGVNPVITTMLLARRVARTVLAEGSAAG